MSDTVKLIIEIPKSDYKAICANKEDAIIAHDTCRRIANNGIPLDENKGEWISVSERLPLLRGLHKISDDVLITNGFEIDMGYLVERKEKIFWHYYGSEYEVGIKDEDNDATAWMPLPEPYKKGGE